MYSYLWGLLLLDWYWLVFVFWLAVALVVWFFTRHSARLWPFGVLFVTGVLFQGIVWHVWWPFTYWHNWLFWLFQAAWWLLLIAAVVNLFIGGTRDLVPTTTMRVTAWLDRVVRGLLGFIALVTVLTWLCNLIGLDLDIHRGDSSSSSSVSTGEPTGTPTATPTGTPTGSPSANPTTGTVSDCGENSWQMSSAEPTKALKVTRVAIQTASTGMEAFHAFKYGWYDWALDNGYVLHQLAAAVGSDAPSAASLVDNGCATQAAYDLADSLPDRLAHANYYPEHSAIRVVLPNGTTFRVMAVSGQVQQ